jgi:PAS domain S-box-containing protein
MEVLHRLGAVAARRDGHGDLTAGLDELEEALRRQQAREEELRRRIALLEQGRQADQERLLHYHELFEFAPNCYLVTDRSGIIHEANHAATVLFGTRREFLVGKPLPFLLAAEDRKPAYNLLSSLTRNEEITHEWEARVQPPRGVPVPVVITMTVLPTAEGRPAGLRWLIRDMTLSQRVVDDLRAQKAFADGLIDMAQAAVVVFGGRGHILRVNAYLEALSGHPREEFLGEGGWQLLVAGADRAALDEFLLALATGRVVRRRLPLQTAGGRQRSVEWSCRPLAWTAPAGGAAGDAPALLAVGHDITDLEEAQRHALQLERLAAIGEMAAGLAHESRNALQRGQACLDRLRWRLDDQPELADLVTRARQANNDLLRLYEDVGRYAAPLGIDRRPCDVARVWREAWANLTSLFPGRDARLDEDAGCECVCHADAFRLGQVFRNVFENSLAACADPVRVTVRCREVATAAGPALEVAVRDNGPGLNAEQRQRLFEPFYTTKVRGTGLGMAIAKRIVEAHGGRIAVGDPAGPGAEILFTLPRGRT